MTPDQAKPRSVHRLKWMLSNGFWVSYQLKPENLLFDSLINSQEFSFFLADQPVKGFLENVKRGSTFSWSMWASEPLAIQETQPSSSPQSDTAHGKTWGAAGEIQFWQFLLSPTVLSKKFFQKLLYGCKGCQHAKPFLLLYLGFWKELPVFLRSKLLFLIGLWHSSLTVDQLDQKPVRRAGCHMLAFSPEMRFCWTTQT